MLFKYGGRVSPFIACVCTCVLSSISFAQSTPADTAAHDSIKIHTITPVTVTGAASRREQPVGATNVSADIIRQTPATSTYELLRQAAGLEVHQQGQGPGFASDASLRGFSSDHSTDLALWIDGVPVNEPINGQARVTTTGPFSSPEACRTSTSSVVRQALYSATSHSPV